ncbi:MAG: TRAP transporter substrate-binding protein [Planctomycetes bacterium]|nr:TRAP transporter substrate-binding protein [Planctomycetota bacterium]
MNKKSLSFFIVGVFVGLIISIGGFSWYVRSCGVSGGADGGKTILKLGHGLDPSHPVHKAMLYMAQRLEEKSGGTVELQISPGGVLGSETESIELLQRGALAMTKVSASPMEGFIPEMAVFSLPYIFRSEGHFWNVLTSPLGKNLLLMGEEAGLRGLCYYDSGSRNFYSIHKPIQSPDDLKGMKIRVMKSPTAMDMIEAMGGSPTPIPWGELYTALQQKMVDGAENNPPSFYTNRHFEVCKYFSFDEHTRIPDILLMSAKVWNSLSPQIQQWVQEAADESSVFQRKLWKEKTDEAIAAVKEEGVEIFYPDKEPFMKKVAPMLEKYDGTPVGDILTQIREIE